VLLQLSVLCCWHWHTGTDTDTLAHFVDTEHWALSTGSLGHWVITGAAVLALSLPAAAICYYYICYPDRSPQ
jgi:hypothetical protein